MSISIIIINYNSKSLTGYCLKSIQNQLSINSNFQLVLVENGCKKEEILKEGDFKHVFLNKNYGFPAGVNVGVKACRGEWVLVLNNDCVLREDFIQEMEKELDSGFRRNDTREGRDDSYQIFSPKIYQGGKERLRCGQVEGRNDNGDLRDVKGMYGNVIGGSADNSEKNIIYACGDKIDKKGMAGNIGRGEVDRGQYDGQKEAPLASFACILIKKEILEKFPLDESYFGYYEDVDFCLRAAKAGYKIKFVPQAVCWHLGEASFGKLNNLDNEMRQFRNLSFTVIKNFSLLHIVRHWMIFNLKSFRYYFFMKRRWKFLWVEWEIFKKAGSQIIYYIKIIWLSWMTK